MIRRSGFALFALVLLLAGNASALVIVAPSTGTVVSPGAAITVVVRPSAGETVIEVAVTSGLTAVIAAPSITQPGAFEAAIHVPIDRVGPAFLIAMAKLPDGMVAIEYVRIQVDPGAVSYVSVSAPPALTTVGQIVQLDVTGLFEDGVLRNITDPDTGTTYTSSNDAILGVDPNGLLQARSRGVARVDVANRGQTATAIVSVNVPDPLTNHIPAPNAGPDRTVATETVVILSAAASADPDGDALQYRWQQQSGRVVVLRDENTAEASFVSPRIDAEDVLEFSLVVIDDKGASSFPAIVRITVSP